MAQQRWRRLKLHLRGWTEEFLNLHQKAKLEFRKKRNNNNSILTEAYINHDQIHQTINNWLGSIFFSPRNIHTKALLGQLHPGLEGVAEVDTDLKGRFMFFKVTLSNNRVLCVCVPSGRSTKEQLIKGRFFEGLLNIWKINVREMKTKFYLEALILLWIKWTGMVEIKHKDFIDIAPKIQDMQRLH